jgi:glycosyltransferase involved in cell wall biosynthesis
LLPGRLRGKLDGMFVSIVIATYNRPESLENALKSISLQTQVRFEVVVVNDGGEDVGEAVARWSRVMPVRYLHLPLNGGLARARNAALKLIQGDVACFLDDDDLMLPGHLRAGVEQLAAGDADAVYTQVAVCDRFIAPGVAPPADLIKAHFRAPFDSRLLRICNFIPVNAVFLRRRSDAPLWFDEELPQLEDWDLWLRLHLQHAYRFDAVPRMTAVYHRVPGFNSMTSRSKRSAQEALRYRDTFRQISNRYPSDDAIVTQGRAIHDHFYGVVAEASRHDDSRLAFSYEQLVESLEAFTRGELDAEAARSRVDSLPASSLSRVN